MREQRILRSVRQVRRIRRGVLRQIRRRLVHGERVLGCIRWVPSVWWRIRDVVRHIRGGLRLEVMRLHVLWHVRCVQWHERGVQRRVRGGLCCVRRGLLRIRDIVLRVMTLLRRVRSGLLWVLMILQRIGRLRQILALIVLLTLQRVTCVVGAVLHARVGRGIREMTLLWWCKLRCRRSRRRDLLSEWVRLPGLSLTARRFCRRLCRKSTDLGQKH